MEKLPGNTELKVTTEDKAILDLIKVIHSRKFLLSRCPTYTDTRAHIHKYVLRLTKPMQSTICHYHQPILPLPITITPLNRDRTSGTKLRSRSLSPGFVCGSVSKSSSNSVSVALKAVAISHAWDKVRSIWTSRSILMFLNWTRSRQRWSGGARARANFPISDVSRSL